MNVYVWERVSKVSNSYHEEGGLVVIAADEPAARALANAERAVSLGDDEAPTYTVAVSGEATPRVFTFPDAGCC